MTIWRSAANYISRLTHRCRPTGGVSVFALADPRCILRSGFDLEVGPPAAERPTVIRPCLVTSSGERSAPRVHFLALTLRRLTYFLVLATSVGGCISFSPPEVSLNPLSAAADEESLDCALAEATSLGYTVTAAESGVFFKAERVRTAFSFDAVDVATARGMLSVVPSRSHVSEEGRHTHEAEESAVTDAETIIRTCATGS